MENKFVKVEFDKFNQKTTSSTVSGFEYGQGSINFAKVKDYCWLTASLRHVKTLDIEALLLDVKLDSKEWLFLRNGELLLVIDNENFSCQCQESDSMTNSLLYQGVTELVYYTLTQELLKKICDSNELSIRIKASTSYIDLDNTQISHFKTLCQQFYNGVYDNSLYTDSINQSVLPIDLNKKKDKGNCFIATATMGNYDHPVVVDLRIFRDEWLLKRNWGIKFTKWYYTHGPKAANVIEKSKLFRSVTFILIVKPLQLISKLFR